MKNFTFTKATVRLRPKTKIEHYVYIEYYPVFVHNKIKRVREYINRTVTTVEWDKKSQTRSKQYKPKRDSNGLIICRNEADRETILFADNIRKIRQKEYDNYNLYSDDEKEKTEQKKRAQVNFIEYFIQEGTKRHSNDSLKTWYKTHKHLKTFAGDILPFEKITVKFCEDFKYYLQKAPSKTGGALSQNTAAVLFSTFKAALHQAFKDEYLTTDIASKVNAIKKQETRREYLTIDELNKLAETPCSNDDLKHAALFSALTGLRHCDIAKMRWKELQRNDITCRLNFTQQKTKGIEYMPISHQAAELCGEPRDPENLIFEKLPSVTNMSTLQRWITSAGITRKITFHCFRHTFATLQLANNTDIFTISKLLGHRDIKTTQIYAKIVDEKKEKAANAIKINLNSQPNNNLNIQSR